MSDQLSQAELLEIVDYDAETGVMRWRKNRGRVRAGEEVGSRDVAGYIQVQIKGKMYRVHRLVWLYTHGEWPKGMIDHINRVKDDNRLSNLRDVSARENVLNTKPGTNVSWREKEKKWFVSRSINDKTVYLGLFREWHDAVYHAYYTNNPRLCGECFVLYGHPECKCRPTEEKKDD